MSELFLHIVNMSISAGYIVLAVLLLRLLLKKAPKWIAVVLWGIVAVRLVCPFSIESVLSLIPSAETFSPDIMTENVPSINTGIPIINNTFNPVIGESLAPAPGDSANPLQIIVPILAAIWLLGIAAMLIYTIVSYIRLVRQIGTAVLYKENIYQSENVISPFVLGLIKPRIYLPFDMNDDAMTHVIAHEQAHISRRDHLWKPLGFLLLTLHWFNPLMWLAYIMLCRDIELACDEKVIKELDQNVRADYSQALLNCSVNRGMIAACPLAFGEVGVKERVKTVLSYKKPAFWIIVLAIIAAIVVAVCFLTDPKSEPNYGETNPDNMTEDQKTLMDYYPEYFGLDASDGLDVVVWQMGASSYSFGLVPHNEIPHGTGLLVFDRNDASPAIDALMCGKGMSVQNMRELLSTYDIPKDKIHIILWQHPLSSYISPWSYYKDDEDRESKKAYYTDIVWNMLFPTNVQEDPTEETGPSSAEGLLYATPGMSHVRKPQNMEIKGNGLYDADTGEVIGILHKTDFDPAIFESIYLDHFSEEYVELLEDIGKRNKATYEVELQYEEKGVGLYYLMIQNDGSTILVYGHYNDGVKENFVRWIFNVGKIPKTPMPGLY